MGCTCSTGEAKFGRVPNYSVHPCTSPSLREGRLWRSAALQARLVGVPWQIPDGFVRSFLGFPARPEMLLADLDVDLARRGFRPLGISISSTPCLPLAV